MRLLHRAAVVQSAHLQQGSALGSASHSTAREGSGRLKMRPSAPSSPFSPCYLAHRALAPKACGHPQPSAAPAGNHREEGTRVLHVRPKPSANTTAMWTMLLCVKNHECRIRIYNKSSKAHNSPWTQFRACCYCWESFPQFSEGFELGPDEANSQTASPLKPRALHSTGFQSLGSCFSGFSDFSSCG